MGSHGAAVAVVTATIAARSLVFYRAVGSAPRTPRKQRCLTPTGSGPAKAQGNPISGGGPAPVSVAWSGGAVDGASRDRWVAVGLLLLTATLRLVGRLLDVDQIGALVIGVDVYAAARLLGLHRRPWPIAPWALGGLALMTLPVEHTLQQVLSYPLRIGAASTAALVLAPLGISRQGTLLVDASGAVLQVDVACSGATGLYVLAVAALVVATRRAVSLRSGALLLAAVLVGAGIANAGRLVLIVVGPTDVLLAEPGHTIVGLIALGIGAWPLVRLASALDPYRPTADIAPPAGTARSPSTRSGRARSFAAALTATAFSAAAIAIAQITPPPHRRVGPGRRGRPAARRRIVAGCGCAPVHDRAALRDAVWRDHRAPPLRDAGIAHGDPRPDHRAAAPPALSRHLPAWVGPSRRAPGPAGCRAGPAAHRRLAGDRPGGTGLARAGDLRLVEGRYGRLGLRGRLAGAAGARGHLEPHRARQPVGGVRARPQGLCGVRIGSCCTPSTLSPNDPIRRSDVRCLARFRRDRRPWFAPPRSSRSRRAGLWSPFPP